MRPEIEQDIRREQAETDKAEARKGRGSGNVHILGDAYDRIFGHEHEKSKAICARCGSPFPGRRCDVCGNKSFTYPAEDGGVEVRPMKHDATNIVSVSTGCSRHQVAAFNRKFGHLGVRYRADGVAVYQDRQAKLRVFRERGFFDKDEVRSPRFA